jgi:hypothetical protein
VKLCWRATSAKVSSWRKVMRRRGMHKPQQMMVSK